METNFLIVGGGIAGVTCAETLAFLQPEKSILLLSESSLIKTVSNLLAITKTVVKFDVEETASSILTDKYHNVKVIHDSLQEINNEDNFIVTKNGIKILYSYLCLCIGAQPKLIPQAEQFPDHIIGIRDTDSVEKFIEKLKNRKKILVVGNGGIASEIVFKMKNANIDWVVKDNHISSTFVDPGAAEFFQKSLHTSSTSAESVITKRMRYDEENRPKSGAALGPDWYKNLIITGNELEKNVSIHYQTEIASVTLKNQLEELEVLLTNNEKISCDLIVSATGVTAKRNFKISPLLFEYSDDDHDEGIKVNEFMQTNLENIYAAGDVCCANWNRAKNWFQMKLWTQARQMGSYAAKCISGHFNGEKIILQDFCFEIFTHSTKLFGYKVILLGLYNGQKLDKKYEILLRTTAEMEYVKFVIENHKLQGAILIGETDLEELAENLILNQINLEPYGDDILNPNIDIEDYFD